MGRLIGAYIEITGMCNERCPYCYNEKLVESGRDLPLDTITKLLDELCELGLKSATLSGGEPFLHRHIEDVFRYAQRKGIKLSVISNGTCFSERGMGILLAYQPTLQISFDGYDERTHDRTRGNGNYNRITHGIRKARELGLHSQLNIRINLHRENVDRLNQILEMLRNEFCLSGEVPDITSISLAVLHKTERGGGAFEHYLDFGECRSNQKLFALVDDWNQQEGVKIQHNLDAVDLGCAYNADEAIAECALRIAADGKVYPCQLFTDEAFCIGSVYETSLADILSGDKLLTFIKKVHLRKKVIASCSSCVFQAMCGGGCPAMAYIENGEWLTTPSGCDARKAYFSASIADLMKKQLVRIGSLQGDGGSNLSSGME